MRIRPLAAIVCVTAMKNTGGTFVATRVSFMK